MGVGARVTVPIGRAVVISTALLGLIAKLIVAAKTYGTNDIQHWTDFANAVRQVGPVGIYGYHFHVYAVYNHPPLIGYFLQLVNFNERLGIPLKVSIRGAASIADVLTAIVVFELVRRRRTVADATASGVFIGLSPVLFAISGFHGNTDPIFTMLTFLSVYLLADRKMPLLSGMAIGLALSVKVVPVVAVPSLLVFAATRGRRSFLRFCVALGVALAIIWGPAVILKWPDVRAQVLEYPGLGLGQWGLMQFGHWALDPWWVAWLKGQGRMVVVAVCAVVPAVLVWRRPQMVAVSVALSLVTFLAFSPAFAVQYLAWAAAATFVIGFWNGAAYNLAAALLLFKVYTRWSGGFPWTKKMAYYSPLTQREVVLGVLVWATLLVASWRAVRMALTAPRDQNHLAHRSDEHISRSKGTFPDAQADVVSAAHT
jgi:Dolichyl-phosphate-mannose-protein mannosyltransferase